MIVTCDFETHYGSDYSLKKLSEVDYIMDPRFEVIMCAVKEGAGPSEVFIGYNNVARRLAQINWDRTALLSHNTRFDGAILAWRFGHMPKLYLDTMSMARALTHAHIGSSSLAKISAHLGLPPKGDEVVHAAGKRLDDFTCDELAAYAAYCRRDNDNCYAIFNRMSFPRRELIVIDLALRMFIDPQATLNPTVLEQHLTKVRDDKAAIMAKVAHIDRAVFASNQKFADLLKSRGIEPPKKISKTTGKETWALARNDRAFKDLCHDESLPLEVQAILAARVNAKSTIEETRTERMLGLAKRGWSDRDAGWMPAPETVTHPYAPYLSAINGTGWMPVPLRYYGAHTGRFSGDGGFNFQNFKRDSRIKAAIRAPTGYRIIHRDSSQIEARMVAFLAGCDPLLKAFAEGRDVYCEFGTSLYDRTITKADKVQRWVSKTAVLGLGYGMGAERFKHTLYIGSAGISLDVSLEDAQHIVTHYRRVFPEIPLLWRRAEYLLRDMIALGSEKLEGQKNPKINQKPRGKVPVVGYTANAILLPNGLKIIYPELTEDEDGEFTYCTARNEQKKLFGGKITENISQALARIVITDIMVRVYKDTGYHPILMTHDSLDYVCPESEVHDWDRYLEEQFALRPAWAPELPLASEGGWGSNLLNAEKHENA